MKLKPCGSGNSLPAWLCVGACAAPAVTLALFFPGSAWLSAALMLAVCGGAHFLLMRGSAICEQNSVEPVKKNTRALQAAKPEPVGNVVAHERVTPMPG